MSVGTVWVHTEVAEGSVASITLEILAKAREISSDVVAIVGGDGDAVAAELGAHGATTVLATGDLGGALPGPSVAGAMAAAIAGGAAPAAILIGTTYGGRDVAGRLSVKLDAPVITNIVDLIDEGGLVGTEPVFGGASFVKTKFTTDKPGIFLVRPKSFEASETGGGVAAVSALVIPDLGATGAAVVTNSFVEQTEGPKLDEAAVVVSGGRGLGEADSYSLIESLALALCTGRKPCNRRCWLGSLQLPGRSDRQGCEARRVHRSWHLRCYPASGRHEGLQDDHRDQQGL